MTAAATKSRRAGRFKPVALAAMALMSVASMAGAANAQTTTAITNFTKTDNIYTNLNEQFPNTGPGVPGSSTGVPNSSFIFDPSTFNPLNPNDVNYVGANGIDFDLTSNATGQDFAEVGSAGFGVSSLTLPINVADATNVYILGAAFDGTSFNITLNGTNGVSETFSSIPLPDFNGGSINSVSPTVADQTVYTVTDVGAGGTGDSVTGDYNNYSLEEVGFTLDSAFSGQTLQSATITGNGYETLILGATVASSAVSAAPEPAAWLLMITGVGGAGLLLRRARSTAGLRASGALPA